MGRLAWRLRMGFHTFCCFSIQGLVIPFPTDHLKVREYASALGPQLLITAAMTLFCLLWRVMLKHSPMSNPWVDLATTSVLGALIYIALMIGLWPPVIESLDEIISGTGNAGLLKIAR